MRLQIDDPAEGSWYDYDGDSIMSDFGLTINESTATPFDLTAHEHRYPSRASDPSRDREGAGQLRPARAPTPLPAGAGWLSWLRNDQPQGPFAVDYAMGNLIGAIEAMRRR